MKSHTVGKVSLFISALTHLVFLIKIAYLTFQKAILSNLSDIRLECDLDFFVFQFTLTLLFSLTDIAQDRA